MPTYKKYCSNVWVAECAEAHEKGSVIELETKYGKINECEVHNLVAQAKGMFYYSITRTDGFDSREWAKRRADRLATAAANAEKKSNQHYEASQEGRDFLRLGEPIKIGHHSEKRHRALIQRNHDRMKKCIEFSGIAEKYTERSEYWEDQTEKINLSMPESLDFFEYKLARAESIHTDLKSGKAERGHSFSLTYAKKAVNEAKKNLEIAKKLWA